MINSANDFHLLTAQSLSENNLYYISVTAVVSKHRDNENNRDDEKIDINGIYTRNQPRVVHSFLKILTSIFPSIHRHASEFRINAT